MCQTEGRGQVYANFYGRPPRPRDFTFDEHQPRVRQHQHPEHLADLDLLDLGGLGGPQRDRPKAGGGRGGNDGDPWTRELRVGGGLGRVAGLAAATPAGIRVGPTT